MFQKCEYEDQTVKVFANCMQFQHPGSRSYTPTSVTEFLLCASYKGIMERKERGSFFLIRKFNEFHNFSYGDKLHTSVKFASPGRNKIVHKLLESTRKSKGHTRYISRSLE